MIAAIKVFVAASCFKDLMLDTVSSLRPLNHSMPWFRKSTDSTTVLCVTLLLQNSQQILKRTSTDNDGERRQLTNSAPAIHSNSERSENKIKILK